MNSPPTQKKELSPEMEQALKILAARRKSYVMNLRRKKNKRK